jgi:hypothetical protein
VKRRLLIKALAAAPASVSSAAHAAEPTAREIMERNFHASKIKSLKTDSTMELVASGGGKRERRSTTVLKLQPNGVDSKLLVRFSSPADIKGTAFLQVEHIEGEDDQWIYLPALKKSRRLVANNKKDSFVGSDFSYGDISLPNVDLYRHALLRSEPWDRQDCYVVESVPIDDTVKSNSGYSKKLSWIRKDNFIEAKVEYHDLSGRHLKTQVTSNHKQVQTDPARSFALYREMVNHQTGHKTVLRFDDADSSVNTPDDTFSTRYLERE